MLIIVAKVMNENFALFFHLGLPKFLFRHSLLIRKSDIIQQDELRLRDTGLYTVQLSLVICCCYVLKKCKFKVSIFNARFSHTSLTILRDLNTKIEET